MRRRSKSSAEVRFPSRRVLGRITARPLPVGFRAAERPFCAPAYAKGALILDYTDISDPRPEPSVAAEGLREQAASCRRLASVARTRAGRTSIEALGDHFDEQARKLDPLSLRK